MTQAALRADIAEEVTEIARSADGLQHLLGELMARAEGAADPRLVEEAQAFDRMVQRLHGLAARLADANQTFTRAAPADLSASGDCDLF